MHRKLSFLRHAALSLAVLAVTATSAFAIKLPAVIGSNMVVQRDQPLPIWGWADAGEEITVTLGEATQKTKAGDDGAWRVTLPAQKAGGPLTMTVAGKEKVTLDNILVGEVWICSGQSNMEWSVRQSEGAKEALESANFPKIRLFQVPNVPAGTPVQTVNAKWVECSPATVANFTGVGFFFGRKLHQDLGVPVGLIDTNWGGTRIEPWTPPEGFELVESLKPISQQIAKTNEQYKQAVAANPQAKHPLASSGAPTGLYNGMVAPLAPFAIRGALWYQGESNRGDDMKYRDKMEALIGGWRKVWSQGDFPFLFVQLAPYRYGGDPEALPRIWEAQTASLAIPNTGMAVTTDIGNVSDIHPKNKAEVGRRLALWALAKTYGQKDLVYSGPLYKSAKVEGDKVRISFDHAAGGLASRDQKPLTHFQVAGADGKFFAAKAEADGETVVVSAPEVKEPVAVRFGWHQEAEPNLVNKAGLPASPFRTKD